jgi:ribosomal protein S18 acetylase RimI-like enzyme
MGRECGAIGLYEQLGFRIRRPMVASVLALG